MKRSANGAICSFGVQFSCYAGNVWVDLREAVECAIDLVYSCNIGLDILVENGIDYFHPTLTRSTLVNKPPSRPVSKSSNVTSIKAGNPDIDSAG